MEFKNLTAHAISLYKDDDLADTVPPARRPARILYDGCASGEAGDFRVRYLMATRIVGLPAPEPGVVYITSTLVAFVAAVVYGRTDVIAPDGSRDSSVRDPVTKDLRGVRGFHAFPPGVLGPMVEAAV